MLEAMIYPANAGELLSDYEHDMLRELDDDGSRGKTGEDRHPC
jgi:hypothetical protein